MLLFEQLKSREKYECAYKKVLFESFESSHMHENDEFVELLMGKYPLSLIKKGNGNISF